MTDESKQAQAPAPELWDDETGLPVKDPADLNRRTTDKCDSCGKVATGWLYHEAGATGRVCAVLFICDCCASGSC